MNSADETAMTGRIAKALTEGTGLLRAPQRVVPLIQKLVSDKLRLTFEQRQLYSYATIKRVSGETLIPLLRWILDAQRSDGGIAAYYSLLTGYSESYPEVTGYIVPTLYDFAHATGDGRCQASRRTRHCMVAFIANADRCVSRWLARRICRSRSAAIGVQHGPNPARPGSRPRGDESSRDSASGH